jgi:hypothetical protein
MRRPGLTLLLAIPLAALWLVPAAGDEKPLRAQPVRRPPIIRPGPGPGGTTTSPALSDEEALKQAGLTPDDPRPLVEYLKARTLTDVDQTSIGEVIKKFGADDFEERLKATAEVERFGPAAIGPLKRAEGDPDPEVAYRAREALKRMEKVPHSQVAAAAVRALAKLRPKEAAAVLLGFLPMADSDEVAEEIRAALVGLAAADGKPEPALVAALSDKSVVRRSAAYVALAEGGRLKEALPLVAAAVRKEADTDAKFLGLWSLLMGTRQKEFVPDLIDMIPKLPRGRIWQLEEFLLQLAGKGRPDAKFGKTPEALAKAREAWAGWWKAKGGSLDLAKFDFKPRVTGYTDIIELDYRYGQQYHVVTLGPDLKVKARIGGLGAGTLNYPSDVKKLSGGNYLIAEQNGNRLTERDSTGRVVKTTNVTQPLHIDLLPGGGMVVVCRNQVVQYDKEMKQLWSFQRPNYDIMGGRRLPGGDVVFVTNAFQGPNLHRLEVKEVEKNGNKSWEAKDDGKPLTLGRMQQFQSIDVTGDDRVLVCEFNRVAEYDLKAEKGKAKELWNYAANSPTSCQRLPNGNTLIAIINQPPNGKVLEVDPAGEVVWEYESKDGLRPARAYRR